MRLQYKCSTWNLPGDGPNDIIRSVLLKGHELAYAKTDADNRIIVWSNEPLGDDAVEFSNGDELDAACKNGLEDYVIEGGKAVYRPTRAKKIEELKSKLEETDYIASKAIESIIGSKDVISLLSTLKRIGEEYAETLKQREEWRGRINELEGGE